MSTSTYQNTGNALYVSVSGSDNNPGTEKEPLATLEKARDTIREIKKAHSLPQGGITVYIRGGIYTIANTLKLTSEDSGTEDAPITWRAHPGESVHFSGGTVIKDFTSISDPAVLERINKEYHDKILQTDLKAQSITNYGELQASGFGLPTVPTALEFFFKGNPMTIARYPNDGWLTIAEVPQTGDKPIYEGSPFDIVEGIRKGRHYGRFAYHGNRPERWGNADDILLHGYWSYDFADSYVKVKKIDTELSEIHIGEPHDIFGYTKYRRYYALNILEELDEPGEWYLDRGNGILYFWPPSRIDKGDAVVSVMDELMVSLEQTSYIKIEGLIFEYSRASAVAIEEGHHNTIAGCAIRNTGKHGVSINGGTNNSVKSCDIHHTGDGGVNLNGGDYSTPGNNSVTNNHIHDFSRVHRTYTPAINGGGVGNVISRNLIHDAPHAGIMFSGDDHIIEFNEFHHLATESGDVGAIYMGTPYFGRGTIIKHNYFHDIYGGGMFGAQCVYLDNFVSGTTVYGNVFVRNRRCVFVGGGRDNIIENNVFVECAPSVYVDARGLNWFSFAFEKVETGAYEPWSDNKGNFYRLLAGFREKESPHSARYPELRALLDDEPEIPKNNEVVRNISYGGRWMGLWWLPDPSIVKMKENIIADPELYKTGENPCEDSRYADFVKDSGKNTTYYFGDKEIMEKLKGNLLMETDPGFVDAKNGDFRLKEDSPAWKVGFKPIPFEEIGLYVDEYRTALP